jgi:hypothetical protein
METLNAINVIEDARPVIIQIRVFLAKWMLMLLFLRNANVSKVFMIMETQIILFVLVVWLVVSLVIIRMSVLIVNLKNMILFVSVTLLNVLAVIKILFFHLVVYRIAKKILTFARIFCLKATLFIKTLFLILLLDLLLIDK